MVNVESAKVVNFKNKHTPAMEQKKQKYTPAMEQKTGKYTPAMKQIRIFASEY